MTRTDGPDSDRTVTCLTAASIVRVAALTVPTDLTITPSAIRESFRMLTVQVPSADVSPERTARSSEGSDPRRVSSRRRQEGAPGAIGGDGRRQQAVAELDPGLGQPARSRRVMEIARDPRLERAHREE